MRNVKTNTDSHILIEGRKPVILLSVQNTNDRRLIEKYLSDDFTVDVSNNGIAGKDFDLCILDERSFVKNRERLKQRKEHAAPLFLPFLLLSQDQQKVRNNAIVLEFADDVVYIPVSPNLLQSRINLLLKQREYSLKLEEKNRQLTQKNQELVEEKKRYQLITENATDMISRHSPDGIYLYVSPASQELVGYKPEELVGQNAFEHIHPDDQKQILKQNNQQFKNKSIVRRTFRKKTKSKGYKWVETTMRPIRNADGKIIEIQASTRDISARKRYERKLREEKAFIDKAIESLPELFFLIDDEQNFVRWNNIERELGYSDEEVEKMHPLDFYQEQDQPFIISKIQEAFENGNAEAEVEMVAKNGEMVPYFVAAKSFNRGGENYIVGSCINLSDIKEAQYELRKNRQLLDAIINQTKAIIYVKDEEGRMRLVNNSYLQLFDLDREEVIGKTDQEIFGDEFASKVVPNDRKVHEEGRSIEVEESIPYNGEMRYYHTVKYPLNDVPGFEHCICGISTEVTDRKKALHKLHERIKEQQCLYSISSLTGIENNLEKLFQDTLTMIPSGFQLPDNLEAAITFDGQVFKSKGYQDSGYEITAMSHRIKNTPLKLQVQYVRLPNGVADQPFLDEEQKLIESIADTLSSKVDRMQTQQKLKESKDRWQKLVNNDPDLIQITDSNGIIEFINPAGARLFGMDSPEDLIGQNYHELIEIEEFELAMERNEKILNGEEVPPQRFKIVAADGKERYLRVQSVLTKLEDGRKGIQNVAEDITDRTRYEKQLKDSLAEKETLLQEIHHRVKNNLAVVSGMMELQTFSTDNEEVRSMLADSKNRIQTMALIHEKLYQSRSLSKIDFGSYVKDLLENIRDVSMLSQNVEIDLEYDTFNLNVNQAVPCALIINEVVSNAFEHAFTHQDHGKITVRLEEKDDKIKVTVSDNGKGLPEDIDEKESDSLGFVIIDTLLSQLEADKQVDSTDGLSFSFSFRRQEIKGSTATLID